MIYVMTTFFGILIKITSKSIDRRQTRIEKRATRVHRRRKYLINQQPHLPPSSPDRLIFRHKSKIQHYLQIIAPSRLSCLFEVDGSSRSGWTIKLIHELYE